MKPELEYMLIENHVNELDNLLYEKINKKLSELSNKKNKKITFFTLIWTSHLAFFLFLICFFLPAKTFERDCKKRSHSIVIGKKEKQARAACKHKQKHVEKRAGSYIRTNFSVRQNVFKTTCYIFVWWCCKAKKSAMLTWELKRQYTHSKRMTVRTLYNYIIININNRIFACLKINFLSDGTKKESFINEK